MNTLPRSSVSEVKVEYSSSTDQVIFTFTYETVTYSFTLSPHTLHLLLTRQISDLFKPNRDSGLWRSFVADLDYQDHLTITLITKTGLILSLILPAPELSSLLTSSS